ncbi:MAG: hypothetical protein ACRBCI_13230 [Cellvibrionaceae bacterium]
MSTATAEVGLDLSMVQPADIILTTSPTTTSRSIRAGTCGSYSHAILSLYDGRCIQAMPGAGVDDLPLNEALEDATYATLYRHKFMDVESAGLVCSIALEQRPKKYDKIGAARSGVSSGCGGVLRGTKAGFMVELLHDAAHNGKHAEKFFCSELIAYAFEQADMRLLDLPFHAVSPRAIATSKKLILVKDLIIA